MTTAVRTGLAALFAVLALLIATGGQGGGGPHPQPAPAPTHQEAR